MTGEDPIEPVEGHLIELNVNLLRSIREIGDGEETKLTIRLQQIRFPKLADADIIEYDHRSGDITRTEKSDTIGKQIETARGEKSRPFRLRYRRTSAGSRAMSAVDALSGRFRRRHQYRRSESNRTRSASAELRVYICLPAHELCPVVKHVCTYYAANTNHISG